MIAEGIRRSERVLSSSKPSQNSPTSEGVQVWGWVTDQCLASVQRAHFLNTTRFTPEEEEEEDQAWQVKERALIPCMIPRIP